MMRDASADIKKDEFEYDVAFSFTVKNEQMVKDLYEVLKDRIKCFVYFDEQKKLAGKDGELTFNQIFGKSARTVVIVFDSEYGQTPWTRIEETAIKNRAFTQGYDFVLLIPGEDKAEPPSWLPKNRIWLGLKRWGMESVAAIIEHHVREFSGTVVELSMADKIGKKFAALDLANRNQMILESQKGVEMAKLEFRRLVELISSNASDVNSILNENTFRLFPNKLGGVNIWCDSQCLSVQWYQRYSNSLSGAYCRIALHDGYYDENLERTDHFHNYELLSEFKVLFDIDIDSRTGWSEKPDRDNFILTSALASKVVEVFFEQVHQYKKRNG